MRYLRNQVGGIFIACLLAILCFVGAWAVYRAVKDGNIKQTTCQILSDTNTIVQKVFPGNKEKVNQWFIGFQNDIHCEEKQNKNTDK